MTAHKLLYWASPTPSGKFVFRPKTKFEDYYQVIVVDEISMLPKTMWDLLLRHKIYILALGDPEQLPPVDKDEDNHVLDNPHVFLDEIMRQAQESEIIRLSMHVREFLARNSQYNTRRRHPTFHFSPFTFHFVGALPTTTYNYLLLPTLPIKSARHGNYKTMGQ